MKKLASELLELLFDGNFWLIAVPVGFAVLAIADVIDIDSRTREEKYWDAKEAEMQAFEDDHEYHLQLEEDRGGKVTRASE